MKYLNETLQKTMSSTSHLSIIKSFINDNDNNEQTKMIAHINLLLLAILGGCEGTHEDYNRLISKADLKITNVFKTDSLVSIIEGSLKN